MMKTFLLCVVIPICFCEFETIENFCSELSNSNRSFVIDYDHDVFLKDGEPFNYISGTLHYFRFPRAYWRDRMQKFRAAGLNTITTSIEWNTHEPCPGKYNFDGEADIEHFLQLATDENLLVILNFVAYINGGRDFGGLPSWLLTLHPNIKPTDSDPDFRHEVEKWLDTIYSKITKYFYGNGGPIIMVKVEMGMGADVCNMDHKIFLRDLLKKHVRDAAVLFTAFASECTHVPGVYNSVLIRPGSNVTERFSDLRKIYPRGPLVTSEFWVGQRSFTEDDTLPPPDIPVILKTLKELLDLKANFEFYLFASGNHFGFKNGATFEASPGETHPRYRAIMTLSQYGSPIGEAGVYTLKYHAIRSLISEKFVAKKDLLLSIITRSPCSRTSMKQYYEEQLPDLPNLSPIGEYGKVRLESALSIFNAASIKEKVVINAQEPRTFEELNVKYGYVLYETKVPDNVATSAELFLKEVRDRAIIFLNQVRVGILSRRAENNTISLPTASGKILSILIENQGRLSNIWEVMDHYKGLRSTPTLNNQPLENWTMTGLPFRNIWWVHDLPKPTEEINPPALYVGELILPPHERPRDTFVDLTGWGKGVIFINDFNIGRYWPSVTSQATLYVPGCYLRASPQKNTIVVFETDYTPKNKEIVFRAEAILK